MGVVGFGFLTMLWCGSITALINLKANSGWS